MHALIVSSHKLIARSVEAMLMQYQNGRPSAVSVCDPAVATARALEVQASVVLVEAVADFPAGLATVRALTELLPNLHVVVLGTRADEASVFEAVVAGVDGFVTWDAQDTVLWDTLCTVQEGALGLPGDLALCVVRQLRQQLRAHAPRVSETSAKLTLREQEIFSLVRRGMRSREIAQRLTISKGTVDKHVQNILDKLNVHSRTQALFLAGDEPPARSALRNVQ